MNNPEQTQLKLTWGRRKDEGTVGKDKAAWLPVVALVSSVPAREHTSPWRETESIWIRVICSARLIFPFSITHKISVWFATLMGRGTPAWLVGFFLNHNLIPVFKQCTAPCDNLGLCH